MSLELQLIFYQLTGLSTKNESPKNQIIILSIKAKAKRKFTRKLTRKSYVTWLKFTFPERKLENVISENVTLLKNVVSE